MTRMAALQNGRILRFLIVIGAVVLTIFIYASYSNTSLAVPIHIRASPALASSSSLISMDGSNSHYNTINNQNNTIGIAVAQSTLHRNEVDVNVSEIKNNNIMIEIHNLDSSINNSNDRLRYSHVSNNYNNNINTNTSNENKSSADVAQKSNERHSSTYINSSFVIQDSESVLIPTSNIQTFVLNADRILQNLTKTQSSAPPVQQQLTGTSNKDNEQQQKQQSQIPQTSSLTNKMPITSSSSQSSLALPPSALIPANRIKTSVAAGGGGSAASSNSGQSAASVDPTQGIPTRQIYESGHHDVNPQLCPDEGDSIKLLIIITSAQSHQEARLAIRQTWGHYGTRRDVAIAFILGRTDNRTLENALNQENYIYGDLIRGHFVDSYNNLTLKTISALEWVDQYCPQAKFVLKTDDDMFINVPKLMAFVDKHQKDKRVIYGRLAKKWKPIRNKKSKYYVSTGQFSATIFPPFTTGPAYVMSADIIHDLYMKALQQTYLKLEDVFTTGIVAQQLAIKRIHVNEFLNRRIAFNPCNIRKTISVHMIKSNEQFDLWKKLLDQTTKCK